MSAPERPDFMKGIYIPPQPTIIEQVREVSPDLQKISELIEKDAGISANIIRTVNSSANKRKNEISSISHAVTLLGLDAVINIMNGLMIRVSFEKFDTDDLVEFWNINEDLAFCSQYISKTLSLSDPQTAYMFALFKNCGLPLLSKKYPDYKEVLAQAYLQSDKSVSNYLFSEFNTCHATVGYYVAKTWKLPAEVCEALRHSLTDYDALTGNEEIDELLVCSRLAELICNESTRLCGAPENLCLNNFLEVALTHLGMSDEDYEDFTHECAELLNERA